MDKFEGRLAQMLMDQPGFDVMDPMKNMGTFVCPFRASRRQLRAAIKTAEAKDGRWYKPHYRQNERHLVEIIE